MGKAEEAELQDKLRRWLTETLGSVEIDSSGSLTFRQGSARVFVDVETGVDDGETFISVYSPVLFSVPKSPELFEWVARSMSKKRFGAFYVGESQDDPNSLMLIYQISLLGTFVDQAEFDLAWKIAATEADNLDDELQERFGGERFHED